MAKILVIDDEQSIVELLSLRLTEAGHEVVAAAGGRSWAAGDASGLMGCGAAGCWPDEPPQARVSTRRAAITPNRITIGFTPSSSQRTRTVRLLQKAAGPSPAWLPHSGCRGGAGAGRG